MSDDEDRNKDWHLSKSIPLTLIFAIACQTVALIWFVASLRSDVDNNAKELVRQDTRISSLEEIVQNQAVTMGRIDENIKAIRTTIEAIAVK
jgi:hypothetical protein